MPHVLTESDLEFMRLLKSTGILIPIKAGESEKPPMLITIMCNSGHQFLDRANFYGNYVACDIHPVLTHGGGARLSPGMDFFDPGVENGLSKALKIWPLAPVAHEGHYPCSDMCGRGYNFKQIINHTARGWVYLQTLLLAFRKSNPKAQGKPWPRDQAFFHLDYTGVTGAKNRMETFIFDPQKALNLLSF